MEPKGHLDQFIHHKCVGKNLVLHLIEFWQAKQNICTPVGCNTTIFAPYLGGCFQSVLFNIARIFSSHDLIHHQESSHQSLYDDVFGFVPGSVSVTQQGFSCCWALHSTKVLWLLPGDGHEPKSSHSQDSSPKLTKGTLQTMCHCAL